MYRTKDGEHHIADAILKIRQDNKLSQEKFAEITGVTRQAVSRWEMGISVPSINTLLLISEKFGISVDAMLKEVDDISEKNETDAPVLKKKNRSYGFILLTIGILGLTSLPFLAEWCRIKNMEVSHSAYTYSYNYIFEYPLSIILVLALLLLGSGIYFILHGRARSGH
ncbi:MAG: helix-turn-helix transcriptional regulator [Firmicutes bacterium]|nr:helix-turn-helix transcriptional regulator [Bacillota bacterium]